MSGKIYNSGLHRCQWCSQSFFCDEKVFRFNGFSYDSISRFVDSILKHKKVRGNIINKIMSYTVDENVLDLSAKPWLNKKYIHSNCGAVEIINTYKLITSNINDIVKT